MKIAFVASHAKNSQAALQRLTARYGQTDTDEANVIVVLGGDGFMLHSLHQFMYQQIPLFGLRCGTVGFLMNNLEIDDLPERIEKTQKTILHPLSMQAQKVNGEEFSSLAINEVSLLRQTKQSAHIEVRINDQTKIDTLVGDGIMVATPAGSTAYNLSAHGPVIPLGTKVLAITPISPFRPRRWRGAIIPSHAEVCFRIQNDTKRPVAATADNFEVRDVKQVIVKEARDIEIELLFDAQHNLEDRIINEQFA